MHVDSPNARSSIQYSIGEEGPPVFADGPIETNPISIQYRVALVAVAVGVLALPAIYLAIITAVAYALYFHITRDYRWSFEGGSSSGMPALVGYVGLGIVGLALLVFLIRPLFIRTTQPTRRREITLDSDEAFFEFVGQICRRIKAPEPSRIFVDWTVNASASLVPGFRGFFRKNLELTIGLPIVSRLTVAQCGGVIAHELGHFSQDLAMRLGSLIRRSNDWFGRVAFQPELIEQQLDQTVRSAGLYGWFICLAARVALWLTRQILHLLLLLGHAMSCYSLRQMEFDADLWATKIAGAENFSSVSRSFHYLSDGFERAVVLLQRGLARQRCARDFIALVRARAEVAEHYEVWSITPSNSLRTHWFDTHPAEAERVARVKLFRGAPALSDSRSARILFRDFETLSRSTTDDFYRYIGLQTDELAAVELDEFCCGETLTPTQNRDVGRFFSNRTLLERPIVLSPDSIRTVTHDPDANLRWIERWHQDWGTTEKAFDDFLAYRRERFDLLRTRTLLRARARLGWNPIWLQTRSLHEADANLQRVIKAMAETDLAMESFDRTAIERLTRALGSIASEERNDAIRAAERLAQLGGIWAQFSKLQEKLFCLVQTHTIRRSNNPESKAGRLRLELALELNQRLEHLKQQLEVEDPFEQGETIATMIARRLPPEKLPPEEGALIGARECLSYLQILYFRLLAQICTQAAAAEESLPLLSA